MKTKHTIAGFTLVELIVVIAVIGVLAAILIPSMMGYTRKAKHSAANANAKSLLNAGMLACRESDVTKPIEPNTYTGELGKNFDGSAITNETINHYIGEHYKDVDKGLWAIKITEDIVVSACVADSAESPYVGTYPHPNLESQKTLKEHTSFEPALKFGETGSWS